MRSIAAASFVLLTACMRPYLAPVPVPPAEQKPAQPAGQKPAEPGLQFRDDARRQEPQAPGAPAPQGGVPQTTNEEATRAWLDKTIQERRAANPDTPPVPIQQTTEHTTYVDRPYVVQGYDQSGQPVYAPAPQRYETPVPVNTFAGASLGALIGCASDHTAEGAWIGAGVGLLFDVARWVQ